MIGKVGTYVSNGAAPYAITGLGFAPVLVWIIRDATTATDVVITWKIPSMPSGYAEVSGINAICNDTVKTLDADGFTLGSHAAVNYSGDTYHYVAFAADATCLHSGTYAGNGSDNRNITGVGFQPDFALVQSALRAYPTLWFATKGGDSSAEWYGTVYGWSANVIQGVGADGFQVGTDPWTNSSSGETYYYFALKNQAGSILQGTYTGNGADDHNVVQSDAFQPDALFLKHGVGGTQFRSVHKISTLAGDSAWVPAASGSGDRAANLIQAINADGFQVGSASGVNENAIDFHYLSVYFPPIPYVISRTSRMEIAARGWLRARRSLPIEAIGRLPLSRKAYFPIAAEARLGARRIFPIEANNLYSLDLPVSWDIRAKLDELFLVQWDIIQTTAPVDFPVTWDIRRLMGMDLPVIWDIIPAQLITLYADDIQLPTGSAEKT
jgi:hypothetical protein